MVMNNNYYYYCMRGSGNLICLLARFLNIGYNMRCKCDKTSKVNQIDHFGYMLYGVVSQNHKTRL